MGQASRPRLPMTEKYELQQFECKPWVIPKYFGGGLRQRSDISNSQQNFESVLIYFVECSKSLSQAIRIVLCWWLTYFQDKEKIELRLQTMCTI